MNFRIRFVFSLLVCSLGLSVMAQNQQVADSLYQAKKYTEAFQEYEHIYTSGKVSEAMLVKMAYIKEGLGDYTMALYYLHHYYRLTSNKQALEKMRSLAEENELYGYEYTDLKFLMNKINQYSSELIVMCLVLGLLILTMIYRRKSKGFSVALITTLILILTPAFVIVNDLFKDQEAIVIKNQSLLMDGPSAGAELIDLIAKGNKVRVVQKDPIWTLIEFNGEASYIRTENLIPLI